MDDLSLADMIAPVPGEAAVGVDLRAAGPESERYLTVKDDRASARVAEREALAAGDPEVDPITAGLRSWRAVAEQGGELLSNHAKDLQVAAWLVEAWLRTDGFPGLADGFTLLAELVDRYWDEGLYPQEDEDGLETRLAPLFGLFGREEQGTLIQPIKLLSLTDREGEHVALWTIEALRGQAIRHDDPDIREELTAKREQRIAQLDAAVAGASPAFIAASLDAIEQCLTQAERLMASLDRRTTYGRFGSQVAAALESAAAVLRQNHVATAPEQRPAVEVATVAPSGTVAPPVAPPPKQKPLDRDGALATLLDIAGFFDTAEPQSLIGQGLRDLVRRANLPLGDLLAELLPDRDQRAMFMLRAGIRAQAADGRDGYDF